VASSPCERSVDDALWAPVWRIGDRRNAPGPLGRLQRAAVKRSRDVRAPDSSGKFGRPERRDRKAIDDYIAHGSANLKNLRAVLVGQRGDLLAERYYNSDAAEHVELQSATKSVISTLVGIALTKGDLKSLDQTIGELLPQHRGRCRRPPPV
jgi:CubicO group peptidase (beta-lactamase class C family)